MTLAPRSAAAQVAFEVHSNLIDIPGREQAPLGEEGVPNNPPHLADIPDLAVSPMINFGQFKPYMAWAKENGGLGQLAYDKVSQQHVLLSRGRSREELEDVASFVNGLANRQSLGDPDYFDNEIFELAPQAEWFARLAQEYTVYGEDDTPMVLVNMADI